MNVLHIIEARADCEDVLQQTQLDDLSIRAFMRQNIGVAWQFRLERLGERLARTGELAVRHNTWGFAGDRATFVLDNDLVLKLKLYWRRTMAVSALLSLQWEERIGWVAVVRTTGGDQVVFYAWQASI